METRQLNILPSYSIPDVNTDSFRCQKDNFHINCSQLVLFRFSKLPISMLKQLLKAWGFPFKARARTLQVTAPPGVRWEGKKKKKRGEKQPTDQLGVGGEVQVHKKTRVRNGSAKAQIGIIPDDWTETKQIKKQLSEKNC